MPEVVVRHHGEQRVSIFVHALANGAHLLTVTPCADARFPVGGDVGDVDLTHLFVGYTVALPAAMIEEGERLRIMQGVATVAVAQGPNLPASCDALTRRGHADVRSAAL